jgi:glycosyltransferase involved in cell wall biosynthesis
MSNILLSIVVPTINRYDTLKPLLEALLNWESCEFEIVIHDNSADNKDFLFLLNQYADERIKYYYQSGYLSAIENCDLAISKANGQYICFIGDDDGLSFKIIDLCKWMSSQNIDSAYCNIALYTWPDSQHSKSVNYGYNGILILPKFSDIIELVNLEDEYNKVLTSGGQSMYRIPRVYQGVVSKKCLDLLNNQLGTYFPGPVPDMSNAMGLYGKVTRHCYVDLPVIISGHSKKSMSGKNSRREHQGEIKSEKSLPLQTGSNWDSFIPFFWSAPTIWAQACIEATKRIGESGRLNLFKYHKLYASCFVYCNYSFYSRVLKSIFYKRSFIQRYLILFKTILHITLLFNRRAFNYFKKIIFGIHGYQNSDIFAAMKKCDSLISDIKFSDFKIKGNY